MTALFAILTIVLIAVIVVQIGRVTELASKIRGEEEMQLAANRRHGLLSLIFMVVFLLAVSISGLIWKNYYLGFGPNTPASEHGHAIDNMFKVTLFFTGIVFIITQILLFYFAWRYQGARGRKAVFMPHDNKLEVIWTAVPAVVMTFLVISGLDAWNTVMADIGSGEEHMEIEATGFQFAWQIRYPGADGKLGGRDFKLITANNPVGQDWKDEKNIDDFMPSEIVLPVGKKVRVRITSRDVLHNFYLPHFRVKMDAVPGMPTYFVFTPKMTTEEYRLLLREAPEYQKPADPADPQGPQMWENFEFELACAELCGKGHYSMRRVVRIVSEEEYQAWVAQQQSHYLSTIRGTEEDPNAGRLFDFEIKERREAFNQRIDSAVSSDSVNTVKFENVYFESGSARLTEVSHYELDFLIEAMGKYPNLRLEIAGHTDSQGEDQDNMALSQQRAKAVYDYLTSKGIAATRLTSTGFGETRPVDTNDTDEGREKNRRIEFRILSR